MGDTELERELRRERIAADLRTAALADPERARACLELARREGKTNVAGHFAKVFRDGEWPARRGAEISTERKRQALVDSLRNLVNSGHVDEAHDVVDDRPTLTQTERNEYHSLIEELVSDALPEAPVLEQDRGAA